MGGDRYHATQIQRGAHLSRCLIYIDLNMVRCGEVDHPRKWKQSAWAELTGIRQRCRIINRQRLLQCLWMDSDEQFKQWHQQAIEAELEKEKLEHQAFWSKALAVGDREWLEQLIASRRLKRHEIIEVDNCLSFLQGIGNRQ